MSKASKSCAKGTRDYRLSNAGNEVAQFTIGALRHGVVGTLRLPVSIAGEALDLIEATLLKASEQAHIKWAGSNPLDAKPIRHHYRDVHDHGRDVREVFDGRLTFKDFRAKYLGHMTDSEASAWGKKCWNDVFNGDSVVPAS